MHENMHCALIILIFFLTRQAEAQQGTVVNDRKLSERATARTPRTGVGGQYGEDVAVLHGLSALLQAPERRRTTAGHAEVEPAGTCERQRMTASACAWQRDTDNERR